MLLLRKGDDRMNEYAEYIRDIWAEIAIVLFMAVFIFCVGYSYGNNAMKSNAAELGYAEYASDTGDWQWKSHSKIAQEWDDKGGE